MFFRIESNRKTDLQATTDALTSLNHPQHAGAWLVVLRCVGVRPD